MRRLVIASAAICALAVLSLSACSEDPQSGGPDLLVGPGGADDVQVLEFRLGSSPTELPILVSDEKAVVSVTLEPDNALLIVPAAGLGADAVLTRFTLFESVEGKKGRYVGVWSRDEAAAQPVPSLAISQDGTAIRVANTNAADVDFNYFFAVTAVIDGVEHDSDPELKVKKTLGG